MKDNDNNFIKKKKRTYIVKGDGVTIQTCNTGGSALSGGTSCIAGMGNSTGDNEYEEPELIYLDEGVTTQTCNTGSSEISCGSSCTAGISPDNEENLVVTICNTGK